MTTKQSKNIVKIIGTLVENSLKEGTYTDKNGKEDNYISGVLTVRVNQTISGKEETNDIPVNVWVKKTTNAGKINPAYDSVYKAMTTYTSLAVVKDESLATKVLITSGNLSENIYSNNGTQVYCTPRINSNFINSVTGGNSSEPEATFLTDVVVGAIEDEVDKDGVPTGRLKIKGMVGQYGGRIDVFDFFVENPNAITFIRSYYQIGDTVQISGKIRFTTKVDKIEVPTRFGDPQYKSKTTISRELIITGDSSDVLTQEQKFTDAEVKAGLALREQAIEAAKARVNKEATASAAKPQTNGYGF
jgi:hypothetical protein